VINLCNRVNCAINFFICGLNVVLTHILIFHIICVALAHRRRRPVAVEC